MSKSKLPALTEILVTFADFFCASPIPLKVLDQKNRILYTNKATERLLGRSEEELRAIQELDLVHSADLYRFRERFFSVVAGETNYSEIEVRHHHADGHWIPTLVTHVRLPPGRWPSDWVLELCTDLSQHQELKEQIVYLQSKQLLGQMARGIAHDYNNLLAILNFKLEFIAEEFAADNDDLRASLDELRTILGRMGNLSQDLSRFGRAQFIDIEEVDLNETIESMSDYFRYVCPGTVSLSFDFGKEVPTIHAAPTQLEQVLLNLVVNARDAILAANHSGTIRISTSHEEIRCGDERDLAPGHYAVISVSDDGIGMSEETKDQIFEPFFSTKGSSGSGIGLSTVYAIVEQGRGYIDVSSIAKTGTTICIYLPRSQHSEAD